MLELGFQRAGRQLRISEGQVSHHLRTTSEVISTNARGYDLGFMIWGCFFIKDRQNKASHFKGIPEVSSR